MVKGQRTLTTKQVADELGLASATVQKYARDGRIPFVATPGGHRRFCLVEVRDALSDPDGTAMLMRGPLPAGGSLTEVWPSRENVDYRANRTDDMLRATITPAPVEIGHDAVTDLFATARRVLVSH